MLLHGHARARGRGGTELHARAVTRTHIYSEARREVDVRPEEARVEGGLLRTLRERGVRARGRVRWLRQCVALI